MRKSGRALRLSLRFALVVLLVGSGATEQPPERREKESPQHDTRTDQERRNHLEYQRAGEWVQVSPERKVEMSHFGVPKGAVVACSRRNIRWIMYIRSAGRTPHFSEDPEPNEPN